MLIPIFIRISVGPFLNQYLPFFLQGSILPPWASAAEEDLRAPSPGSPEEDSRQEGGVPPLLPGTPVPSSCPSAVGELLPPLFFGSAHPELNGRQVGVPPLLPGTPVPSSCPSAVGELLLPLSPGSAHPELNSRQVGVPPLLPGTSIFLPKAFHPKPNIP